MTLLDDIKRILKGEEPESDPWGAEAKPKVTDEEISEAIEKMKEPKPVFPWWRVEAVFVLLWMVGHLGLLYVMIGSPIAGGILVYVLVNLYIFSRHLLILAKVNRK